VRSRDTWVLKNEVCGPDAAAGHEKLPLTQLYGAPIWIFIAYKPAKETPWAHLSSLRTGRSNLYRISWQSSTTVLPTIVVSAILIPAIIAATVICAPLVELPFWGTRALLRTPLFSSTLIVRAFTTTLPLLRLRLLLLLSL
jgi:hypothetical protein